MATAGGCELDLEGFERQLQSLFKSFKNSTSLALDDAVQVDLGKAFCSDFSKLVEEYTCHWQTPLPRLRILEVAICCFVRGSYLFRVGCDDVRSMLSSLALSVFELLLFFDEMDFNKDPLKHFIITFQECHMCLLKHPNVHLTQVSACIQEGGPWANPTLQSILEHSPIPQTEVDRFISSQLPVVLELRVRYLLTCERIIEAMALAQCCSQHPTAGQHHFFLQVYLTCLHKTAQHDRLNIEVAQLNGKDAVQIICNMESEEGDQSMVLTLARAFLSQQLRRGYMDHLGHLVFLWSKLQLRLHTSKQVLIAEIQQLMLTATNVNSIFPFIKVLLEELGRDGHQFCVQLCTKALQSCQPCDVPTKLLIYKTLAGLFPNDLEMCQICALLVFFLERTVEAFKMVFSLYINPDQDDHAQPSPISNQVRFETLQVLKMGMHFDPEFWNPITLRANCLNLLSDTVASDAIEEIMAMWVPDYCMKEPDFHSSTTFRNFQQRAKVVGAKKRKPTQKPKPKRFKVCSEKAVDLSVKRRNTAKRSGKKASAEYLRQGFWRVVKTQEDSKAYHRFIVRLSEKNPSKRDVSKLQWYIEDPEHCEPTTLSDYRKLRPNIFFFLGDMPYLYTSMSTVVSNSAAAKSQHPQTSRAQDSQKEPLNMKPAVVLTPLPTQMVLPSLYPTIQLETQQQCSNGEDEDDGLTDSGTSMSGRKDGTSKTQAPQANTNVFFFLGDMPYLYTSVSPVAANRPADKSQHAQTSSVKNSHKEPLNMEPAVVPAKLDPLNMEQAVVNTNVHSQKDQKQLKMEPLVVLTKLDSQKRPVNMELPVVLSKLYSHKPTDPVNMESAVVYTKLDSPTDPVNMESAVVHAKLDSPTDPVNMESAVVHTKLDSPTDPLNIEPAVILTPLPLDMVHDALSPPEPQFSSVEVEYEDPDIGWESPDESSSSEGSDWLEYVAGPRRRVVKQDPEPRRRFLEQDEGLIKDHATSVTQMLQANRNGMEAYLLGSFTCPECPNVAYTSAPYLWKHMRRCHNHVYRRMVKDGEIPESPPPVNGVDPNILKQEETDESIEYSHRLSTRPVPKRTYKKKDPFHCEFCLKIFDRYYQWKEHQRVHTGEKNFPCELCDKRFGSISNLKRHLSVHDGPGLKKFECLECGKSFSQVSSLKRHHRVHTGEKPYQCLQCTCSFTERSSLKVHQRNIHFREKFQCDQCDRSFGQPSNLRRHKATHSGIKPFQCGRCEKSFYHLNELRRHETIHDGLIYQCEDCNKCFGHIESLKRHYASHNEKPFQCLLCDSSYTTMSSLNRHQRDVHDDPFLNTPMLP